MSRGNTIPLSYKREDLLALLRGKLPAAKKADEKALADHRKKEEAYLASLKQAWRAALKWDYKKAKASGFNPRPIRGNYGYYGPSCPKSQATELESLIYMVERTQMQRMIITKGGKYDAIYRLLTADQPKAKGLCE